MKLLCLVFLALSLSLKGFSRPRFKGSLSHRHMRVRLSYRSINVNLCPPNEASCWKKGELRICSTAFKSWFWVSFFVKWLILQFLSHWAVPAYVSARPTGVHCAWAAQRKLLSLTKETRCQVAVTLNNGCRWSFWATTLNSDLMPRILSSVWKKHSKNKNNHLNVYTVSFFSGSIPRNQGRNLLFLQLTIKTSSRNVNVFLPCVMGKVPFSVCCKWNLFHFKILYRCPAFRSQIQAWISWILPKMKAKFQAWIIIYCEHGLYITYLAHLNIWFSIWI